MTTPSNEAIENAGPAAKVFMTELRGMKGAIAMQAKVDALREVADGLDRRAEQFDKISDNPKDRDYETLVRYGSYAAEARSSAYRLRGNADQIEGATP